MDAEPGATLDVVTPQPTAVEPMARRPRGRVREAVERLFDLEHGRVSGFKFYAGLRRLECQLRSFPRFGEAAHPSDEPVRLGQDPSLAFRTSALATLTRGEDGRPARVSVGFFGAFGPHGPLPTHLTEYAFERKRHHGDGAFAAFFDIFHHRLLMLLYRAWADAEPTVSHDRPDQDHFARRLGALIGLTSAIGDEPYSELDFACLFTAQHFVGRTRHAEGLVKMLRAIFRVPVRVEEFVGRWLEIEESDCWRIPAGHVTSTGTSLGVLGQSSRVGTQIWDQQSAFEIVLGPLSRLDYQRFLPGMPGLSRLTELVERYAGLDLGWTLRLVLREPERRATVLGVEGSIALTAHIAGGDGDVCLSFEDIVLDPARMST
jgi:type VI secretion system protein ImpH